MEERKLSDADVDAITESLKKKVITEFYQDLGQGVWGLVRKAIVISLVTLAAYGAARGLHN